MEIGVKASLISQNAFIADLTISDHAASYGGKTNQLIVSSWGCTRHEMHCLQLQILGLNP